MRSFYRSASCILLISLFLTACAQSTSVAATAPTPAPEVPPACAVTTPPEVVFTAPLPYPANAPYPNEFWYGSADLWTMLPVDGAWRGLPFSSTGFTQKVFWWRADYDPYAEPQPALTVVGRRLDGEAPALRAASATHALHADFHAAMLVGVDVPTAGCWQITGTYGAAALSFVVRVEP